MAKRSIPNGFKKVETTLAGFWKPDKVGQSIQGVVGEAVTVKSARGEDDKPNTFYTLMLTSTEGGPVLTTDDKPVKLAEGMMVGVGGKMLAIFLRGREGREVYLEYAGLGPKKAGQNPAKLYETYERLPEEGEIR